MTRARASRLSLAFLAACLLLFACKEEPLTVSPPTDRPLYGCTPEAEFFVHESLVRELKAGDPSLSSAVTEWEPRPMARRGEYWVFGCPSGKDLRVWDFYRGFTVEYQFRVGRDLTIPNKRFMELCLFPAEEVSVRADVGFVFMTRPAPNPFLLKSEG